MEQKEVGRLAFRREGRNWVAYWALPDTMEGAIFLGSVPVAACERNQMVKDGFMAIMQEVVSTLLPGATWPNRPVPAPKHERSGNA